ncbi:non-canonical purine NTP pyrophosphatase, RdgB/HAM1 family [PVC group bacterium (ex Bugula neritina AB1)]|nr:non-canonical purine NTP pyrophosphatase, RdgB/HAM1 family [PVC group bacterium (ex Bugula neritina AB1)]
MSSRYEKIVLATTNEGKRRELLKLWQHPLLEVLTLQDFPNVHDVVEDGETFETNAIKKAREVSLYTGLLALADDSGLKVDALNGEPGVYSARYSGDHATSQSNIDKLLHELKGLKEEERKARFVCCMVLMYKEDILGVVRGSCEGYIIDKPRGSFGFGYDSVFFFPAMKKTFAEMTEQEKNEVSHRAQALKKIDKIIRDLT